MKRWAEHFDSILNRPPSIHDDAINRLPQVECNLLLDEFQTVSETVKAIKLLSSGKAPGSDAIPAEIYKAGGSSVAKKMTKLVHIMWRKRSHPLRIALIIHVFKRKGNPQLCDNHRGISLLSIAGKVLARVLLNRLNEHLEQAGLLPESQCGFRKDRGTIDMIFTVRQLQVKCKEQNMDLNMIFVDLTKAFDTVSREGLWKIMAKLGCRTKFIAMVSSSTMVCLHGSKTMVSFLYHSLSQMVSSKAVFSMMFSAMLTAAFQDVDNGIPFRYRFNGKGKLLT